MPLAVPEAPPPPLALFHWIQHNPVIDLPSPHFFFFPFRRSHLTPRSQYRPHTALRSLDICLGLEPTLQRSQVGGVQRALIERVLGSSALLECLECLECLPACLLGLALVVAIPALYRCCSKFLPTKRKRANISAICYTATLAGTTLGPDSTPIVSRLEQSNLPLQPFAT